MNVPTPDDVFAGVLAKLSADAGYDTQLPGGAWYARRGSNGSFPYLIGTVQENPPFYEDSAGTYLQTFLVELSVWVASTDGAGAATNTARAWLDSLLGWSPSDPAGGVSVPNAVGTVSVKPVGGALELNDELRRGQDVFAAGKRLEVSIQGKRS